MLLELTFPKRYGKQKRDYQTVKTLLDRITGKGYLKMDKLGPLCIYSPAVSRASVVAGAVEIAPRIEQRMHVLVHGGHFVGLRPVALDAIQEVERPDEERQDEKPCQCISKVVAFVFDHRPPIPGR